MSKLLPTRTTRSRVLRPLLSNRLVWDAIESVARGKVFASEANETRPSLLPVGTSQLDPLVCNIYTYIGLDVTTYREI